MSDNYDARYFRLPTIDRTVIELLEILKANDAQFDTCELACEYTHYSSPPSFPYERKEVDKLATGSTTDPSTTDGWTPEKSQMSVGIRWPDIAVRQDYVASERRVDDYYTKSQCIGQNKAYLGSMETGDGKEWYLERSIETGALNSIQQWVRNLRFSLGVGYGEQISEIKSLAATDGGYQVEATSFFREDGISSVAQLHIDTDYIVRKAVIESGIMIYYLECSGTFAGSDFKCAKVGSFERRVKKTNGLISKFDLLLKDVKLGMSEERFEHLADLSTPSNERRFERMPGESTYTRISNGSPNT